MAFRNIITKPITVAPVNKPKNLCFLDIKSPPYTFS